MADIHNITELVKQAKSVPWVQASSTSLSIFSKTLTVLAHLFKDVSSSKCWSSTDWYAVTIFSGIPPTVSFYSGRQTTRRALSNSFRYMESIISRRKQKINSQDKNWQLTFIIVLELESFRAALEIEEGLERGFELLPLLSNVGGLSPRMSSFRLSIRVPKTFRSSQIVIWSLTK